jgi:hypothetical protein
VTSISPSGACPSCNDTYRFASLADIPTLVRCSNAWHDAWHDADTPPADGPLLITADGAVPVRKLDGDLLAALAGAVTDWDRAVEGVGVGGQRLRNAARALLDAIQGTPPTPPATRS